MRNWVFGGSFSRRTSLTARSTSFGSRAARILAMSCGSRKAVCTETPPVKSMSNRPLPRWKATSTPATVMMIENVRQTGNQAMKSMCVSPMTWSIFSFVSQRFRSAISKITRATNIEVHMLNTAPSQKVTAKPLTCSVPTKKSTEAAMRWVRLALTMTTPTRWKELRMAMRIVAPRWSSSRMRS